ncbi:hypothetical protein [uncultured Phascolarctobacterium sp.]|uniref:hypothetical protein n=1 Tax=uncultured Phascolarctobacterium sp. TaxID=512296 RepID=UPI0025F05F71|nr:hypothetical protein [uncultured Phascolarctobacterium sp.]
MYKNIDSNLNGNNEHKKFTHLQKWLFKFEIIKFLFDNSPNDFLYIMIKITSCYTSIDELNVLKKHEIIKNNARKLFLNNVLEVIAIVLSVYALITTVIEKGSINHQIFSCNLVYIVTLPLLIWIWVLYTHCLVKKSEKTILAIEYILDNYEQFYNKHHA